MNIHEYQSKQVLRSFGVNVPNGKPAFTVEEAVEAAKELNAKVTVVKAQIHAGGRGKAGGVKIAKTLDEVKEYATELLGKVLVTHQTGPEGKKVNRLLIEEGSNIAKEYYLSFVNDRNTAKIVMIGSEEGGMEIEKVAAEHPEKIIKEYIDISVGLLPFQATRMAYKMNFKPEVVRKAAATMQKLYNAFIGKDCSQVEINPLVVTAEDDVICLDAKLNFDDSGLFRHPDIVELRGLLGLQGPQIALQLAVQVVLPLQIGVEQLARRRQPQGGVGAVQQGHPQIGLQLGQILAQIGLGQVEPVGSLGDAVLLDNGEKIFRIFHKHERTPPQQTSECSHHTMKRRKKKWEMEDPIRQSSGDFV